MMPEVALEWEVSGVATSMLPVGPAALAPLNTGDGAAGATHAAARGERYVTGHAGWRYARGKGETATRCGWRCSRGSTGKH